MIVVFISLVHIVFSLSVFSTLTGKNTTETKRVLFQHLVILDQTGSMYPWVTPTVNGVNEVLTSINASQVKFNATQEHFVTLVTFSTCETRTLLDAVPASTVQLLTEDQFYPQCGTPLYDAIGQAMTGLELKLNNINATEANVLVTIITDGEENASLEYNLQSVSSLIQRLKKKGWHITYLGTNQDAEAVAKTMSIDHAHSFAPSEQALRKVMSDVSSLASGFTERFEALSHSPQFRSASASQRINMLHMQYSAAEHDTFDL